MAEAVVGPVRATVAPEPVQQGRRLERIGVQLYTVRNRLAEDFFHQVESGRWQARAPAS